MKIVKTTLIVLLVLILGIMGASFLAFNGFSPKDPEVEVDSTWLPYYTDSYGASRAAFLDLCQSVTEKYSGTESLSIPVASTESEALFVDVFYLPAQDTCVDLMVISSGVHGVEGFTGSAVQRMIVVHFLDQIPTDKTGLLLLHGLNPYGFDVIRRVTENNVDLNRNCDATGAVYNIENQGYSDLYDFINPTEPVRYGSIQNRFFYLKAIGKIIQSSMSTLRQAVLQGQYQYPDGLYFGGERPEPQIAELLPVLARIPRSYQRAVHIDLHTGYGERGKLHLFPNPPKSEEVRQQTEALFEGFPIDWGDGDDFYTVTGEFTSLIGQLNPSLLVIPMTFEFGTLNSQTTMGSLVSIHNMILENQGRQHGYANSRSQQKVREDFIEMYYPSSDVWRSYVMDQTVDVMETLISKLRK